MAGRPYNPASLRIIEASPGTVDVGGVVALLVPAHTTRDRGRGVIELRFSAAPAVGGGTTVTFEPTQDPVDPRLFTIPGTDSWVASSIRVYVDGQRLRTSLLVVSGTGNRTIQLDPSVPAPDLAATPVPTLVEGEGVKV
jgi:hypothetical protein